MQDKVDDYKRQVEQLTQQVQQLLAEKATAEAAGQPPAQHMPGISQHEMRPHPGASSGPSSGQPDLTDVSPLRSLMLAGPSFLQHDEFNTLHGQ